MMDADKNPTRDDERLNRIAAAFQDGIVLVDADGSVVWMDRTARRRINGGLRNLNLPVAKSDTESVDCFIAPVELAVEGAHLRLGVIQETAVQRYGSDLIAAIESVFTDSTSWFARTVIEKLRAMSADKSAQNRAGSAVRLGALSDRERDVLGLICEGQSDVAMAKTLGLSENTVRNHIASLYRKIGVNRRTAAVIWARERGITCRDDVLSGGRDRRSGTRRANERGGTLSY